MHSCVMAYIRPIGKVIRGMKLFLDDFECLVENIL